MTIKKRELIDYLVKVQGYDEEEANKISLDELVDLYEMYHED